MQEIQLSISEHFDDPDAFFEKITLLRPDLGFHVFTTTIPWPIMLSFLERTALEPTGLDLSEVGTTWVGSFARMNALTALTREDIDRLGGEHRFSPACWSSASLLDDRRLISVPWLADTRLVFYWKDALERAGIDEKFAFDTPVQMEETLERITASGQPAWAAPTFGVSNVIHQMASWIWAMGCDFVTPDGRASEFMTPDAFEAICSYFRLHRFLAGRFSSLDAVMDAFESRKAAVTMNGPWLLKRMSLRGATVEDFSNLGVALPPGPSFVGGLNLVMWKRVEGERREASISWMAHLTSLPAQRELCSALGFLPVLADLLEEPPYTTNPHYMAFKQALENGRSLPRISNWGILEEMLIKAVGNIWSDLNEDPRLSVNNTVLHYLSPVAKQFDQLMKGS